VSVLAVAIVLIVMMVIVSLALVVLLHLWRKRKMGSLAGYSSQVL
jgi:preprotein translocase subunit SecG